MSIGLDYFLVRFDKDIPAQDGVPSVPQYESAVTDAVSAFNDRYGVRKLHALTTVSGQADYTLPDDFLDLIGVEEFYAHTGNVAVTPDGLVPLYATNQGAPRETFVVNGLTLTIDPTPTYALTRRVWYRAGHVLDSSNVYPAMTERVASIVYTKAQANVWRIVCGQVSRSQAWKYTMGDVTIDKTKVGDALKGWVSDLDAEFDERIKRFVGPVGGLR
ncbi:MAG: hypothetical protein KA773_23165 [Chloroflexi bacterium]|nr:hypothetical protein [Chloroflexota bacterium]